MSEHTLNSHAQFLILSEDALIIRLPQGNYTEGFFKFLNKEYLEFSKIILQYLCPYPQDKAQSEKSSQHFLRQSFSLTPEQQLEFQTEIDNILNSIFSLNNSYSYNFDWPVITCHKFERSDVLQISYDKYLYSWRDIEEAQEFLHASFAQYDKLIGQWCHFFQLIEQHHLKEHFIVYLKKHIKKEKYSMFEHLPITPEVIDKIYEEVKYHFLHPLSKNEAITFDFWREKFNRHPHYLTQAPKIVLGEQPFLESWSLIEHIPAISGLDKCYLPALITYKTRIIRFFSEDYHSGDIQATFNFNHCLGIFMNRRIAQHVCQAKYQTKKFDLNTQSLAHENALGLLEYQAGHLVQFHVFDEKELQTHLNILHEHQRLLGATKTPHVAQNKQVSQNFTHLVFDNTHTRHEKPQSALKHIVKI